MSNMNPVWKLPRPYKECSPDNTIGKVRSILKDLSIPIYETIWENPSDGLYSVRVETEFELGCFGTNGKGLTRSLCLASAYGEFIERLQNHLFLITISSLNFHHLRQLYGFHCFPDEQYLKEVEFFQLPRVIIDDLLAIDSNWL